MRSLHGRFPFPPPIPGLAPALPLMLVLAGLLGGCGETLRQVRVDLSDGIPVGAVLSLSGAAEPRGREQRLGLELALEGINGSGGINGRDLRLRIEDGGSGESDASSPFTLLIDEGMLALIGPTLSQQALSTDPIAQRRGVPVVSPSNSSSDAPQTGEFISRVAVRSERIAPSAIASTLELDPGIRRVAVFYAQDIPSSTAETTAFQQALAERDILPLQVESIEEGSTDLRPQLREVLQDDPDLLLLSLQATDGARLVRQARELGYEGLILAGSQMNTPRILPICARHCDGLLIAQAYSPELDSVGNRRFLRRYRALEGAPSPPPEGTAQAYTALEVVAEALQRLDRRRPLEGLTLVEARQALIEEILAGSYDTPLGSLRFSPEGEVLQQQVHLARVVMDRDGRRGRFMPAETEAPAATSR